MRCTNDVVQGLGFTCMVVVPVTGAYVELKLNLDQESFKSTSPGKVVLPAPSILTAIKKKRRAEALAKGAVAMGIPNIQGPGRPKANTKDKQRINEVFTR